MGYVLKSLWDIEFKRSLFTATIHCQKDVGNDKNGIWEREKGLRHCERNKAI